MTPTVHPSRQRSLRHHGRVCGLDIHTIITSEGAHPEQPPPSIGCGGHEVWIKIGAGPWVPGVRTSHLVGWPETDANPWALEDLPDILIALGCYDIQDQDWPADCAASTGAWHCPAPEHYASHLPKAQRAAALRYVGQAIEKESHAPP